MFEPGFVPRLNKSNARGFFGALAPPSLFDPTVLDLPWAVLDGSDALIDRSLRTQLAGHGVRFLVDNQMWRFRDRRYLRSPKWSAQPFTPHRPCDDTRRWVEGAVTGDLLAQANSAPNLYVVPGWFPHRIHDDVRQINSWAMNRAQQMVGHDVELKPLVHFVGLRCDNPEGARRQISELHLGASAAYVHLSRVHASDPLQSYLRDRLAVARELLTDSGSIFVQIGDENVHLVRSVLDEVFGSENFVSLITYAKTAGATGELLPGTSDFIVWYAKSRDLIKYRQLYQSRELGGTGPSKYDQAELADGQRGSLANLAGEDGVLPLGAHVYRLDNLTSQSMGRAKGEGAASWFNVAVAGRSFTPTMRSRWKTNEIGMSRLLLAGRVQATKNTLGYVRFHDDFPAYALTNTWTDIGGIQSRADPKVYVVQTATSAVQRCLLMTTDPGDLVLDPTCGSGTTAYVAEQWGRRWITTDTSRVALALARTRLMSAKLPYYLLADSPEGVRRESEVSQLPPTTAATAADVRKGFVYKRVPHVTLKSIANNPDIVEGMTRQQIDAAIAKHAETELLFDQPYEDNKRIRVAGPFTVESLAPHRVLSTVDERPASEEVAQQDGASSYEQTILDNLRKAGVQNGRKAERMSFDRLEPFAGEWVQAAGEYLDADGEIRRVAVSLGPQYGTVGPDQIKEAAKEALKGVGFDVLLVCGYAFDPSGDATAQEFAPAGDGADSFALAQEQRKFGRLPVLLVRMNPDLSMGDTLLKSTGAGNLFTVFGEPDIQISAQAEDLVVQIRGVDVYDPTTGAVRASSTDDIALWMIDTAYDGESFFVRHAYFTGADDPYRRLKQALRADIDEAAWASIYATTSRPFAQPEAGRIAVKVINHYGDEILKVYPV